jgi:hypothetical protein
VPAMSSTEIRKQEVHTNGPVLDETILSDPEVIILNKCALPFFAQVFCQHFLHECIFFINEINFEVEFYNMFLKHIRY